MQLCSYYIKITLPSQNCSFSLTPNNCTNLLSMKAMLIQLLCFGVLFICVCNGFGCADMLIGLLSLMLEL